MHPDSTIDKVQQPIKHIKNMLHRLHLAFTSAARTHRFCMSASTEPLPAPLLPRVKLPPLPLTPGCPRGDRADSMDAAWPKPPAAAAAAAALPAVFTKLLLDALRDTCGDMPSSNGCMLLLSATRCCWWCCSWLLLLLDPVSMPPLWSHAWPLRDSPLAEGDGRDTG
jgi:hypothetical protein